ncbi:MAG: cytochrome P450, partial [Proteobacteria bacterium]
MENEVMVFKAIPQPPTVPVLGNLHLMDTTKPVQSIERIAVEYPSIFRLKILKNNLLIISSQELVNEICDESRFDKKISRPLELIRAVAGDGLFTADTNDPKWGKAHRILMAAFGPASLKNMFPGMLDIAEQMTLKIDRIGPEAIDVTDIMTRLTLDTIALTAFGFRFNSFYEKAMHPFVDAMVRALSESSLRARRPAIGTKLKFKTAQQYDEDTRYLHEVADRLVAERKRDPDSTKYTDLLSIMLNAKDPVTGERLDDENIRYQMVTFLIAGHETTSGMLSFAFYEMLRQPEILQKARDEVRRIVGNETPRFEDISKFVYLDQIFKETLRLWPTAPAFALQSPDKPTVIGGRYQVQKNETLMVIASLLHRDPKVWEHPERFDPDRMSPERFAALPPNSWKPFGNGQRGCIGRAFAMQEAILVLAMVLQRFDVEFVDSNYKLVVKETLTLKPEGLFVRFKKRPDFEQQSSQRNDKSPMAVDFKSKQQIVQKRPLTVLFGSNSGSAEAFAQRIANDGKSQGYDVKVASLDEGLGTFASEEAVIIVTASYEGQPPDNARR